MSRGHGDVRATEGGTVVARRERRRDGAFGRAGTGHDTGGDALGHGDDVGQHAEVLEPVGQSRAEDAALHLVADHERTVLFGEPADGADEFLSAGVHATLALDALDHDGANAVALGLEEAL